MAAICSCWARCAACRSRSCRPLVSRKAFKYSVGEVFLRLEAGSVEAADGSDGSLGSFIRLSLRPARGFWARRELVEERLRRVFECRGCCCALACCRHDLHIEDSALRPDEAATAAGMAAASNWSDPCSRVQVQVDDRRRDELSEVQRSRYPG
jgi:hypothetical protein